MSPALQGNWYLSAAEHGVVEQIRGLEGTGSWKKSNLNTFKNNLKVQGSWQRKVTFHGTNGLREERLASELQASSIELTTVLRAKSNAVEAKQRMAQRQRFPERGGNTVCRLSERVSELRKKLRESKRGLLAFDNTGAC